MSPEGVNRHEMNAMYMWYNKYNKEDLKLLTINN